MGTSFVLQDSLGRTIIHSFAGRVFQKERRSSVRRREGLLDPDMLLFYNE